MLPTIIRPSSSSHSCQTTATAVDPHPRKREIQVMHSGYWHRDAKPLPQAEISVRKFKSIAATLLIMSVVVLASSTAVASAQTPMPTNGPWRQAGAFPDLYSVGDPYREAGRSQHIAALGDDGRVWLVSGRGPNVYEESAVTGDENDWRFDGQFTDNPRWSSASARYGSFIYRIGGNLNSSAASSIFKLSRSSAGLVQGSRTGSLPTSLEETAAVVVGDWLYVSGGVGLSNAARTELWAAPLDSRGEVGTFRYLNDMPAARAYHQMINVDGRLYVLGGSSSPAINPMNSVWSVSVSNGTAGAWRSEASLPTALYDHAAVAIGRALYVMGGTSSSGAEAATYVSSTEAVDGVVQPWSASPYPLPEPRAGLAATAVGNRIVVTGGQNGATYYDTAVATTTTSLRSTADLLDAYRPELRYDPAEGYRADSAAMATDNVLLDTQGKLVRGNTLNDSRARAIAWSYAPLRGPDLSLDYLGSYTAATGDRVDEAGSGSDYQADAQRMHGSTRPAYQNVVYGRVVPSISMPDAVTLQYWTYYYYNPKTYFTVGAHEGDWEFVQVTLDSQQQPLAASYSQHKSGEYCDWLHVQKTSSGRPIVYVAEGSHANYFSAGFHFNAGANDNTSNDGEHVIPAVEDVTVTPAWMRWPGPWGNSDASPKSPPNQGIKWTDPSAWEGSIDRCTEQQTSGATSRSYGNGRASTSRRASPANAEPRRPSITVRRSAAGLEIRYRLKAETPTSAGQMRLITSVDAAGNRYPPFTLRHTLKTVIGIVHSPLGRGKGPYILRVALESRAGARSQFLTVRVPH